MFSESGLVFSESWLRYCLGRRLYGNLNGEDRTFNNDILDEKEYKINKAVRNQFEKLLDELRIEASIVSHLCHSNVRNRPNHDHIERQGRKVEVEKEKYYALLSNLKDKGYKYIFEEEDVQEIERMKMLCSMTQYQDFVKLCNKVSQMKNKHLRERRARLGEIDEEIQEIILEMMREGDVNVFAVRHNGDELVQNEQDEDEEEDLRQLNNFVERIYDYW